MKSKIWNFIRWVIGIFTIFIAFLMIAIGAIKTTVLWALAGLLILPPVSKVIPKFRGQTAVVLIGCIGLVIAGMVTVPAPEPAASADLEAKNTYDASTDFDSDDSTLSPQEPNISTPEPSGKSENTAAQDSNVSIDILAILMHQPYLDAAGIKVNFHSERKEMPSKIESALQQEPVHVAWNGGGILSDGYYGLTRDSAAYCYYGKIKNNRPDGFGVLTGWEVSTDDYDSLYALRYAGNFSDGRFDGYGVSFEHDSTPMYYREVDLRIAGTGNSGMAETYLKSYAVADGNWKKGELSGKANLFDFEIYMGISEKNLTVLRSNAPDQYWASALYPTVTVTEIKNEQENGITKLYMYNTLMYDGNMKNGKRDGKGVSYFSNGQKLYDGSWSDGLYHGTGKLYDSEGKLVYSGKWENGDYAS